jgi:hypothetical protein
MDIWNILWPLGNIIVIWYIFPRFGILRQEKSGNPALQFQLAPQTSFGHKRNNF